MTDHVARAVLQPRLPEAARAVDERSMRILELALAGFALAAATLLAVVR